MKNRFPSRKQPSSVAFALAGAAICGGLWLSPGAAHAQVTITQSLVSYAFDIQSQTIVTFDTLNPGQGAQYVFQPSASSWGANKTNAGAIINGLAWAEDSGHLIYRDGKAAVGGSAAGNGDGGLFAWNPLTNVQKQLSGAALTGASSNAGYWNGSYYYITQSSDTLVKITPDFTTTTPTYTQTTVANFDGTSNANFGFGDIAITHDGILFGAANNLLFKYDLRAVPLLTPRYQVIASGASVGTLQILWNLDETTLYATQRSNGVPTSFTDFYTLNPTNGAKTLQGRLDGYEFADISGAVSSLSTPSNPEPAEWVFGGAAATTLGGLILRRRRKWGCA